MMMTRFVRVAGLIVGAMLVASCGQGSSTLPAGPRGGDAGPFAVPFGCYVTKIEPVTVKATVTFYGWPDNSPPGNAIAHPFLHDVASGSGTYCDPTTFATERKNNPEIPYGMKLYVPFLQQYFIREDDCAHSGPRKGHGNNGCYKLWFDLWIGGDGASKAHAVIRCENALTPNSKVRVILNPQSGMPVMFAGPIYRDDPPPLGTCFGQPEQLRAFPG